MGASTRQSIFLGTVVVACLATIGATAILFPPQVTTAWLIAFATLLALGIVGAVLALAVTEAGSTTATDFLPQLAAVLLLGPTGTIALTTTELLVTEFLLGRKPLRKALFNTAQMVLAVAAAALLYQAFGGRSSLTTLSFRDSFPPFFVAVVGYFAVNTATVAYMIAAAEGRSYSELWRRTAGRILLVDLVMSPLPFMVAFLYVRWGPAALLAAIIPIIGLRYSFGVNIALQHLSQDLLRVLVKTLEARDPYTSGHSIRVAERSRAIATSLGLRPRRVRLIETAALLHDIGKLDLAYGEILRQAGPLTPDQRELIRSHPDKGVDIISSVRALDPEILRAVRHHHEWFDGSGYPTGISGEEIPIGARIIMIADSIDAMLTDRPYRSALPVAKVRHELLRNSGSQFDPVVVEATFRAGVLDSVAATAVSGEHHVEFRPLPRQTG